MFLLMSCLLQKSSISLASINSAMFFNFPTSGLPFKLGVKTVDSKPSHNLASKYCFDVHFFEHY